MAPNTPASTQAIQTETLVEAQTKLLREPGSSDLVVKCGEKTWRCQSAILTQRCKFFRAACEGEFKESTTRTVILDDDTEKRVDILLLYLYTLEDPVNIPGGNVRDTFANAEDAYIIGDKYQISRLKLAGLTFMEKSIRNHVPKMRRASEGTKSRWTLFARRLWEGNLPNADGLKQVFLEKLAEGSKHIIGDPKFRTLLEENKDFNFEFITALAEKATKA